MRIDSSRYRTVSGVGVGTSLATLQRIYRDLVVDRADGWDSPTGGLLASYLDVAAIRSGDRAITFVSARRRRLDREGRRGGILG